MIFIFPLLEKINRLVDRDPVKPRVKTGAALDDFNA